MKTSLASSSRDRGRSSAGGGCHRIAANANLKTAAKLVAKVTSNTKANAPSEMEAKTAAKMATKIAAKLVAIPLASRLGHHHRSKIQECLP